MDRHTKSELARRQLDARFRSLPAAVALTPPARGWIRAIRDALGMSSSDLGSRLGVTSQGVHYMESSEQNGTIQLKTLQKAAQAMDCTLAYALIPNSTLEDTVSGRVQTIWTTLSQSVEQTMALEDQPFNGEDTVPTPDWQRLIKPSKLWSTEWDQPRHQ